MSFSSSSKEGTQSLAAIFASAAAATAAGNASASAANIASEDTVFAEFNKDLETRGLTVEECEKQKMRFWIEKTATFLRAIADETRLKILTLLHRGSARGVDVSTLTKALGVRQATVSEHLAVLKNAKAVSSARNGQFVLYSLNKTYIAHKLQKIIERMA